MVADAVALLPKTLIGGYSFDAKTLKSCEGRGGTVAWSGVLLKDGAPVALVRDEGNGGALWYEPAPKAPYEAWGARRDALIADLRATALANLSPDESHPGLGPVSPNEDILVAVLADNAESVKALRRAARTKTIFYDLVKNDYTTSKSPPSHPGLAAYVAKNPNLVVLNGALVGGA